jgi:hypothetical protein
VFSFDVEGEEADGEYGGDAAREGESRPALSRVGAPAQPSTGRTSYTLLLLYQTSFLSSVFRIRIRIYRIRIHVFFGLQDPDPLVRGMDPDSDPALDPDPDPSIIKQI